MPHLKAGQIAFVVPTCVGTERTDIPSGPGRVGGRAVACTTPVSVEQAQMRAHSSARQLAPSVSVPSGVLLALQRLLGRGMPCQVLP